MREVKIWLLVAACSAPPAATPNPPPPPPPAPWWERAPIATDVPAEGCKVDAGWVAIGLSVNGKPDGVFVRHAVGARGEIAVAPGRTSSAHIAFGAAAFATQVDLESTWFRPRVRPPRLGGIFDANQGTEFRVVGGDAARVTLEPGPDRKLAWVVAPTYDAPCADLVHAEWPQVTKDYDHPVKDIARTASLSLRATVDGPVVATATGIDRVTLLETRGRATRVNAWVDGGEVTAWVDSDALVAGEPPVPDRGGGVAFGPQPKLTCEVGAPLLVRKGDAVYIVGALTQPAGTDWRFADGKLVLAGAQHDDLPPWFTIADTFDVTNDHSSYGIDGTLLVPRARCTKR